METPYVQQLCVLDGLMVELCTLDQWLGGCGDTTYMMCGVICLSLCLFILRFVKNLEQK